MKFTTFKRASLLCAALTLSACAGFLPAVKETGSGFVGSVVGMETGDAATPSGSSPWRAVGEGLGGLFLLVLGYAIRSARSGENGNK